MHVLITGGSGFIGSNLVRFVLRHRPAWRVTNLDALSYCGNPENLAFVESDPNLSKRYQFVRGDIRDDKLVERLLADANAVMHLAAESHVDRSIIDARPFVETNVLGTQTILEVVRRLGGRRMVNVSTDEVYGSLEIDQPQSRFRESSPLAPNSPYSASKCAADLLTRSYHHTYGLDVVTTRCSNNFGPYQFPEKVIPLFVTNLLEGRKVPLYGDGRNVRDWIHVEDHCEALLAVLENGVSGEVYNIGGNNEQSNLQLTHAILDIMGQPAQMIEHVTDRPGHDRRYAIDGTRMADELGWRPTRSAWPEALEQTVGWYTEHQEWWQRVKSGAYRSYYEQQYGSSAGSS
jgi:dTDP-glucose 4,6-dehydratase